MAFDPSLLTVEESSGFDPSLLTPEATGPIQPRVEEVPETAGSTLSHYWDVANKSLATLAPRFNKHVIPDALQTLDLWAAGASGDPAVAENVTPEAIQERLAEPSRMPTPAEQRVTGIYNATAGAVNAMTSPVGIATLGMGALPKTAQALVTAGFLAQTAQGTQEAAKQAGEASVTGTPEQQAEAYASLGLQGAMGAMIGHQGGKLLREPVPQLGERIPNASSQPKTAEVYGNVRPLKGEGAGQVPVKESGAGVQPQAEGRLQENAPSEVQRNVEQTLNDQKASPEEKLKAGKELASNVFEMTPDEFAQWNRDVEAQTGKGFTNGVSFPIGEAIARTGDIQFLGVLKERAAKAAERASQALRDAFEKTKDMPRGPESDAILNQAGKLSTHPQFFNEAIQRAEWLLSDGSAHADRFNLPEDAVALEKFRDEQTSRVLPLSEFKGEVPSNHIPVTIQRGDGSQYNAFLAGPPGQKMAGTKIAKVKPSGEKGEPSLSHGVLGKDEAIIKGPKTVEEYNSAVAKEAPFGGYQYGEPTFKTPGARPGWFSNVSAESARKQGFTVPEKFPTEAEWKASQEAAAPAKEREIAPGVLIDPFLYHTAIKPAAKLAIQGAKAAYSNKHIQAQVQGLNRKRQAFSTLFRSFENRNIMDQTMDAADNKAFTVGQQVRKGLEIGHDKADQNAASAIIAAGFDQSKLPDLLAKAQAGKNAEAIKAVQDAMAQYNRLEQLAKRGQADFDGQIQEENWHGINTEYHEDYLPGIYDQDLWMGGKRPFVIAGGGTGVSTGFKKGKTFATPFDAIEAGYTPKSIALSELAEHRVRSGQRLINRKRWADGLRTEFDPTDNKPIVADVIRKPRGAGQPAYEVAPPGYRVMEIIPGHKLAVHEVYTPLFKALTGESVIASSEAGKLALEIEGALKHGLLAFDSYHMSRIAQKSLILTGKLPGKRGRSLLEYADKDLARAVTEGLITPEIAQWVRVNRPVAQLGLDHGLNVGRVQEALYTSFVRSFPGLKQTVGKFNKWVFEDVTRSALMEGFIHEFNRVSRVKPGVQPEVVARQVARDLNTYFGNLGRQGIFKSKTAQDMARLVTLAPQWFESMGRTEAKGFTQLVKGVTYDPFVHKSVAVGSLGKAMGTGLIAYFAGMQVLNLITRRQPTWKNEEEGHKLDAWIPSADGKGNGFWLSPFAIPAEITHDMIRYTKKDGTSLKAAAHVLANKASPPARAFATLATGKSFWGDPKADDTWARIKKAAWSLNPTPIPLQPIEHKTFPGQLQRQVTASLGVKTEPAESPVQQVLAKAKSFMEKQGKKPMTFEMTDEPSYFKLRSALRADNVTEAKKVMDDLLKNHTRQQIFNAMERNVNHPFTGSAAQEGKFKRTLTPKERELYQKAVNDRRDEFRKFKQFRSGLAPTNAAPAPSGFDPSLLTPE